MMLLDEELRKVDLQIKAIAERIADRREAVETLERQGKRTGHLHSTVAVLTDLFARRVRYRDLVSNTTGEPSGTSADEV
jgi:hypothetical protein